MSFGFTELSSICVVAKRVSQRDASVECDMLFVDDSSDSIFSLSRLKQMRAKVRMNAFDLKDLVKALWRKFLQ